MAKIFIGNFDKGLIQDRLPFYIDNNSFPTMYNFYSWRGRAKRKRGTFLLGQLQIQVQSVADATPPTDYQIGTIGTLSGAGAISTNLFSTTISGITKASQAIVTVANNRFIIGDSVIFSGVVGMTQINGKIGQVVALSISGKTITVNINSTGFTAYSSGGTVSLQTAGQTIVPGSINLTDVTNTNTDMN